jgi:hypothetical protein
MVISELSADCLPLPVLSESRMREIFMSGSSFERETTTPTLEVVQVACLKEPAMESNPPMFRRGQLRCNLWPMAALTSPPASLAE